MDNDNSLLPNLRRALFQSPATSGGSGCLTGSDKIELTRTKAKVRFEDEVEASLRTFEKELHKERLQRLREVAKSLQDDDWMYPDVSHLA